MNVERETHWATCLVLPNFNVSEARCGCCDALAGMVITVGWLFWSLHIMLIKSHREEDSE